MTTSVFRLRSRSLARGTAVVLFSLALAFYLSGFPQGHKAPLLVLPAIFAIYGTGETVRCLQARWSFYHGGVLLLVYMDILTVVMILFLLFYPYAGWLLEDMSR